MTKAIWLDNSQTTKPSMAVISRMMPYLTDEWGLLSLPHDKGTRLSSHYKEGLKALYTLLRAKEEDLFILTGSGAEAVNQVLFGLFQNYSKVTGKNHFIALETDEAPALMALAKLKEMGACVSLLKPNPFGQIETKTLLEALTPRTILCSFSYVNGLTGVIQPIEDLLPLIRERGVKLHLEISHSIGKIPFSPELLGTDFLTFGGELIHAPKGTGALWIRAKENLPPLIFGGSEQAGLRGGHLDMSLFSALAEAAREAFDAEDLMASEVARLRAKFERTLLETISEVTIISKEVPRAPHISALSFKGCPSELLLYHLQEEKVYANMGGGLLQEISASLMAQKIPNAIARSALSFSLSRETSEKEIERAVEVISKKVETLRKITGALA